MNFNKIFISLGIGVFLLSSCRIDKTDSVLGSYVIVNNINTIDTLIVKEEKYIRKIYRKDGSFLYENVGKWKIDNNSRINFYNFFIDRDLNYDKDYFVNEEGLIIVSFRIEKFLYTIKIYSNLNLKNSYYKKIN